MQQPHQHGPNCKHGHGENHGHGHGGHSHSSQLSPQQYFQRLKQIKTEAPEFYFLQIMSGNPFRRYLQTKGCMFLSSLSANMIIMLIAQIQMMLTFSWMPLFLRPFVSGMFVPLLMLLFFNSNVVIGFRADGRDDQTAQPHTFMLFLMYLVAVFYSAVALRQSGAINTQVNRHKSQQAHKERPYLQSPMANCSECKILKVFRSSHCPLCGVCVSKFTRHSMVFGVCIGSTNQLLAWLFFTFLAMTQGVTIIEFCQSTAYSYITQIFFYLLNGYVMWASLVQSVTLFGAVIFSYYRSYAGQNFYFGITEYEMKAWMQSKYLSKISQNSFENTLNRGIVQNIKQSVYALFGIPGVQSKEGSGVGIQSKNNPMQEEIPSTEAGEFQDFQEGKNYTVNWKKAFYYMTPHIPYHPYRRKIIELMAKEEPRMMEMYKLQKGFREQVLKEVAQAGEEKPSDFQLQQRVAMKLQQHMMKNGGMGGVMGGMQRQAPSPEQQKSMQIQMLTNMKQQMSQEPEFKNKIAEILENLQQDKITTMEVGLQMRELQQNIMKTKMEQVMKDRQRIEEERAAEAKRMEQLKKQEDQQEQLNKQVPDEDL